MIDREGFRIKSVRSQNFKGFREFSFVNNSFLSLLGGKNGYGKTTLFDIIELVLTGSIARIVSYVNKDDKRLTLDDKSKPLVNDTNKNSVQVEMEIELDGENLTLMRRALVRDMTNPVDFKPFRQLYCKLTGESDYKKIEETDYNIKISGIANRYNFYYYLEQEEATLFLKKNIKDRVSDVNSLFDTKSFDEDMARITDLSKRIDEIRIKQEQELSQLNREIEILRQNLHTDVTQAPEYFRIFKSIVKWDQNDPQLTPNEYVEILSDTGLISDIEYYIENKDCYEKFRFVALLSPYINDEGKRRNLALHIHFTHFEKEIELYTEFKKRFLPLVRNLSPANINSLGISDYPKIKQYLNDDILLEISTKVKEITHLYSTADSTQRLLSELQQERAKIIRLLDSEKFESDNNCPLCGKEYDTHVELLHAIQSQTESLEEITGNIAKLITSSFENFRDRLNQTVVYPIIAHLDKFQITDNAITAVNDNSIKNFLIKLDHDFNIRFEQGNSYDETYKFITDYLHSIGKYDTSIDYNRIKRTLLAFKELPGLKLTKEILQRKRDYLINILNEVSSTKLAKLNERRMLVDRLIHCCNTRKSDLSNLKKDIKDQKTRYLKKLISDVEILFYIYTGRIMQDNFFGRGLFMKLHEQKCVLFVSGDFNNDVDALYRMSSGQLAALIVAFTMTLNKLYAKYKFLAIDDPVQTMDDMNLWGLIDTLRYEFRDYNIILSTHEPNVGGLINYKAHKVNIDSYYYDMSEMTGR